MRRLTRLKVKYLPICDRNGPTQAVKEAGMTKEEANRIIHEARGLCWHEFDPILKQEGNLDYDYLTCKHCRKHIKPSEQQNTDYLTSEGFFACWNWAKGEAWWDDFMDTLEIYWLSDRNLRPFRYHMAQLVDNLVFAHILARFLKDRNKCAD
jgi:hypothetical protein